MTKSDITIFAVIGIIFFGVVVFMGLGIQGDARARDRFMKQCLEHELEYQCTAKWRAGDTSSSTTVMPVIIPSGR